MPLSIQLLEYAGSQKSALWGMKDLFDHANSLAETVGTSIFECSIRDEPAGKPDVLILPPSLSTDSPVLPDGWDAALRQLHATGCILASVCSGAFLLAETGVLDDRRITTHWYHAPELNRRYPKVITDTKRLIVDAGDIVTAGGVMAWTDLTLHMIERFGGRKLMLDVARMFVLDPPDRQQSYYATFVPELGHGDQAVAAIQLLMQDSLNAGHTVSTLSAGGSMSERSFLRRFKKATGEAPMRYLQLLRVEAARSRLELTTDSFEQISWEVGYSDTANFRRIFKRELGLTPSQYRRRFGIKKGVTYGAGRAK